MHRLREFDLVSVATPMGIHRVEAFDANVITMVGQTIALEPVTRDMVVWLPDRVDDAFLFFSHKDAPVALKGDLFHLDGVGDLRFRVGDPIPANHRRATRLEVCAPVELTWSVDAPPSQALTVSVSATGLLVQAQDAATPGTTAEVSLSLPGMDEPVVFDASVVRADGEYVALELGPDARDARVRLARFVHASQLAAFRRQRALSAAFELDF
jgi:PilZ domain